MSNITLFKTGNIAVPDYLRQADDVTKMLAGGDGVRQISIKGGVWRMIVAGEEVSKNEDRAIQVIVLAANPNVNRTYHAEKYEEGKDTPPSCWSNDGKVPDADVPMETRQHSACEGCPQNIAGSGEGNSRACRYSRRIAVTLAGDAEQSVYRLQLPAKSIFGKPVDGKMPLNAYAKFLGGHGVPITGVVTEARFNTSEAVPVLVFNAVRPLTRDEWESAQELAKSPDVARAIEFKMVPKAPKAAGATPAAKPQAPKPAAAPVFAEPQDDAPAPTVRRAKPAATAAAPANDVNSVLSQWATDDDE